MKRLKYRNNLGKICPYLVKYCGGIVMDENVFLSDVLLLRRTSAPRTLAYVLMGMGATLFTTQAVRSKDGRAVVGNINSIHWMEAP